MHRGLRLKHGRRVALTLMLEGGSGPQAAQQALAMMAEDDWQVLAEFALSVVSLAEAVDQEGRLFLFQSVPREAL